MHRTWWPDLPPELLREVSSRLHVAADFARFHAVCKPWRDSHGPSTTTGAGQLLPWLLAPSNNGDDSLNFRCVFSNTSYVVSVTEQSTAATNSDDVLVPRPQSMPRQRDGYLYEHSYVLESRGELLWASVHISMNYPDKGKNGVNDLVDALSMSMHMLEEVTKGPDKLMWTRKDGRSIEDRVLFLGWPNSFAVDASRLGVTGGFAYFLYYDDQGGRLPHERHGVFRYNLIHNTTEFVEWLPKGWDRDVFMWLLPQLTIAPIHQGPATTPRSNNTCVGVLTPSLPLGAKSFGLQYLFSMLQHLFSVLQHLSSMFSKLFVGKVIF